MTTSTVDTSTSGLGTRTSVQQKAFHAAGRFWAFYHDDTNCVYSSSPDGTSWELPTTIGAGAYGASLGICFDGTYVHYARAIATGNGALYYRRGTPQANGTITWSAAEQTVFSGGGTDECDDPSIAVDSNGYPWIAYRHTDSGHHYWRVRKATTNNGLWAADTVWDLADSSSIVILGEIVALTNGKMYSTYVPRSASMYVLGKLYNGAAWGGQEQATDSYTDTIEYSHNSCVAVGDDVHVAFLKKTTYDILYVKRTYGVGWGSEETIQAAATSTSGPVIAYCPASDELYVFWASEPTVDHVYYRVRGVGWDSVVDWIDESANDLYPRTTLTCYDEAYDDRLGVLYVRKTGSPYDIRHAYLDTPTPSAGDELGETGEAVGATHIRPARVVSY